MTPREAPSPRGARRDVVLRDMLAQGSHHTAVYDQSTPRAPRPRTSCAPPADDRRLGGRLLTSWVQQQVVERSGPASLRRGLRISRPRSISICSDGRAGDQQLPRRSSGPSASLVAIETHRRGARGWSVAQLRREAPSISPPAGSASPAPPFKAFDLAAGWKSGISPESTWPSRQKLFIVPTPRARKSSWSTTTKARYTAPTRCSAATAYSDNSIVRRSRLKVGTHRIATWRTRWGSLTRLDQPAMTIGGLTVGVTRWTWRHAYETIAAGRPARERHAGQDYGPVSLQHVDAGTRRCPTVRTPMSIT